MDEWNQLKIDSQTNPIIILKHSNACPISMSAYERMIHGLKNSVLQEPIYYLIVQESRDISNNIAKDLRIQHESPQVIIIKNGIALFNTSHDAITPERIAEHLKLYINLTSML